MKKNKNDLDVYQMNESQLLNFIDQHLGRENLPDDYSFSDLLDEAVSQSTFPIIVNGKKNKPNISF